MISKSPVRFLFRRAEFKTRTRFIGRRKPIIFYYQKFTYEIFHGNTTS